MEQTMRAMPRIGDKAPDFTAVTTTIGDADLQRVAG